jgi:hypothetical protein
MTEILYRTTKKAPAISGNYGRMPLTINRPSRAARPEKPVFTCERIAKLEAVIVFLPTRCRRGDRTPKHHKNGEHVQKPERADVEGAGSPLR